MARAHKAEATFRSLTAALDGSFDKRLGELSEEQRQRIAENLHPLPWDDLVSDQRRHAAEQWDAQHDPAHEGERQKAWNLVARRHEIENDIAELEAMRATSPLERESRERQLEDLRQRLAAVDRDLEGDADERLLRRRDALKANGVKNFNQQLATEEDVSVSRVKQRLKRAAEKASKTPQR